MQNIAFAFVLKVTFRHEAVDSATCIIFNSETAKTMEHSLVSYPLSIQFWNAVEGIANLAIIHVKEQY